MLDSVPLVCITGQVTSQLLGTDAFQESDIIGMTVPVTKWNYQITQAREVPETIAKAFRIAKSGKPGVVLLDITKDAQLEIFDYQAHDPEQSNISKHSAIDSDAIKQAAQLINSAMKPYLLIGHGVSIAEAEEEVIQLAEKADIPVASTLLGLSSFPSEHPLHKGMLGMHGNYAANVLSNEADVVIAVGMRFDDRVTGDLSRYLTQAKVIHIEIDQAEIDKNIKTTVAILADAKIALKALLPEVRSNQHSLWHQEFSRLMDLEVYKVIQQEVNPQKGNIKMAEVINILSKKTNGEALIVTDVGQHQMITARYYKFRKPKSHISSGGLGTMGFALPAAIGAKLGVSSREVIVVSGDGCFQMNIQELAVIAQEDLRLKIIILNNGYLGMVRQWQEMFFEKRYSFTKIESPDFVKVANAYGIDGSQVYERHELSAAMDEMLKSNKSYLLEIHVEKKENVFPMIETGASVSDTRLE